MLKLSRSGTRHEISRELQLSLRTVEAHRSRTLQKIRRSSRAELVVVAYAREHGLV